MRAVMWRRPLRMCHDAPRSARRERFMIVADVAVIGLAVNLLCAWILRDDHGHHHGHSHALENGFNAGHSEICLLYTSPSPRD